MKKKILIAGNWKMNGKKGDFTFINSLKEFLSKNSLKDIDVLICPPYTLIDRFSKLTSRSSLNIGAQDCSTKESGAYTGEISSSMISDLNANYCIVGHSERRIYQNETNEIINDKIVKVQSQRLNVILCIGETLAERKKSNTLKVLGNQIKGALKNNVKPNYLDIAYEPVWAIGTGLVPDNSDIELVHNFISKKMSKLYGRRAKNIRILYGGSVNPKNVSTIISLNNVSGALIGGASLKIKDMKAILKQLI